MRRLLLGAAIVAAGVVPIPHAAAQQPGPTHVLQLVNQTPAVAPGQDFTVHLRAAGAPAGSTVRVEVHRKVAFRSDFQRSLDGETFGSRLAPGTEVPATPDTTVTVPTDPLHLQDGVYPVTIELFDDKDVRVDRLVSYLVRLPANRGDDLPLDIAVVLPVNATPSLRSDRTTAVTTEARAAATAARVANPRGIPITIAASPELVDGLATSSDPQDQGLLSALRDSVADDEVVATPYVSIDAASWWNAGLFGPLTEELDRGAASLQARLAPPVTTTWVADRQFNPGLARWLRDRGVRRVVVPEESLSPLGKVFNFTLTQPFELDGVDGVQAVAADAGLGAHAGSTGDPVLDACHLIADLAILYYDQPGTNRRGTVVTLPSDRTTDPAFFNQLMAALGQTNGIFKASTVDGIFDNVRRADDRGRRDGTGEPLRRELVPAAASDLGDLPDRLRRAADAVGSYRSLIQPDNTRPQLLDQARLVAGDRTLDATTRDAYLDGVTAYIDGELAKITAPARQTIRFTARDGTVALGVQNTTGYPVNVKLELRGSRLEFPQYPDRSVDLALTEETTRVEVRVRTRASGDSPLDVTITTPDGRVILGTTRVTVRSTAFSGLGIILSVGAGLFLVIWWGRHIVQDRRRRPRPRHVVGSHAPAPQ